MQSIAGTCHKALRLSKGFLESFGQTKADMFKRTRITLPEDVTLRRSSRARRLSLRVSSLDGRATLTVPAHVTDREAARFVEDKRHWLDAQRATFTPPICIGTADSIPFEGQMLRVSPERITGTKLCNTENVLAAPLDPMKRSRAIQAFYKVAARDRLAEACDRHSVTLGQSFNRITLRDTRSRWGSCTSQGGLMFSWRLIMAPPDVLNYVAAHEVAHLVEMNHSPAFWKVVEDICPEFDRHRSWLRKEGAALHLWQF